MNTFSTLFNEWKVSILTETLHGTKGSRPPESDFEVHLPVHFKIPFVLEIDD